jgi:hypothetical protein
MVQYIHEKEKSHMVMLKVVKKNNRLTNEPFSLIRTNDPSNRIAVAATNVGMDDMLRT